MLITVGLPGSSTRVALNDTKYLILQLCVGCRHGMLSCDSLSDAAFHSTHLPDQLHPASACLLVHLLTKMQVHGARRHGHSPGFKADTRVSESSSSTSSGRNHEGEANQSVNCLLVSDGLSLLSENCQNRELHLRSLGIAQASSHLLRELDRLQEM